MPADGQAFGAGALFCACAVLGDGVGAGVVRGAVVVVDAQVQLGALRLSKEYTLVRESSFLFFFFSTLQSSLGILSAISLQTSAAGASARRVPSVFSGCREEGDEEPSAIIKKKQFPQNAIPKR